MAYNFVPCNRDQAYLLPPSLRDWLPEGHLAWFVMDAVEQMDLSALYARHRADGWGAAAFEPKMMTTLLVYAYCMGERSSRRIEMLCERDIAFRVITANHRPDHSTISRFRQVNAVALEGLFVEVLRLCGEAGLVKLGVVALDGTKIKANAALSARGVPPARGHRPRPPRAPAGATRAECSACAAARRCCGRLSRAYKAGMPVAPGRDVFPCSLLNLLTPAKFVAMLYAQMAGAHRPAPICP